MRDLSLSGSAMSAGVVTTPPATAWSSALASRLTAP